MAPAQRDNLCARAAVTQTLEEKDFNDFLMIFEAAIIIIIGA